MTQWYGLLAPSKWPKANIAKLEVEAIKGFAQRSGQGKTGPGNRAGHWQHGSRVRRLHQD